MGSTLFLKEQIALNELLRNFFFNSPSKVSHSAWRGDSYWWMIGANMTARRPPLPPRLPSRVPKTALQNIRPILLRFGPWIAIALAISIYASRSFTPIEVFATEGVRREFLERVGAAPSTRIIALVTEWCPACKSLEQNLRSKGVDFVKIDIESNNDGRKLFHEVYEITGSNSIPKVILDRNLISQGRLYMELSKEGL